jgi:hypothetical protein
VGLLVSFPLLSEEAVRALEDLADARDLFRRHRAEFERCARLAKAARESTIVYPGERFVPDQVLQALEHARADLEAAAKAYNESRQLVIDLESGIPVEAHRRRPTR